MALAKTWNAQAKRFKTKPTADSAASYPGKCSASYSPLHFPGAIAQFFRKLRGFPGGSFCPCLHDSALNDFASSAFSSDQMMCLNRLNA
jgi:hypothetical protein